MDRLNRKEKIIKNRITILMEGKVMKTRNSRSNRNGVYTSKSIVLLTAVLFSLSTSAAMVESKMESASAVSAFSNYLSIESDAVVYMEDWMLEKSMFFNEIFIETENDASTEIESWMTGSIFSVFAALDRTTDATIGIESWMLQDTLFQVLAKAEPAVQERTNQKAEKSKKVIGVTFENKKFGRRSFLIIEEDDPKVKFEQWMFDYRHFRR